MLVSGCATFANNKERKEETMNGAEQHTSPRGQASSLTWKSVILAAYSGAIPACATGISIATSNSTTVPQCMLKSAACRSEEREGERGTETEGEERVRRRSDHRWQEQEICGCLYGFVEGRKYSETAKVKRE